ncbi:ATP-binding protein [Acidithiobacillus sp.]|uniref:ATP-binding protein n=1 Tax=Acidithiobacillus sp. TaxID=1872118 RepID=UPI00262B6569|nr:ATP-binding protein [Acidithiobacillus sp.]MDD5279505.1 ATP-binding protein [Acidithiobacillus sp.]
MTSPYASGGGGSFFEAPVLSYYLAALLCELPARGVLGNAVTGVRAQRGELGAPLDDLVLAGATDDGVITVLHLQIKNKISFTFGNAKWIDVLQRAWDTFTADGFDGTRMRFGVGIGRYSARADDEYQPVLSWARYSDSADDFFLRIEKQDFSSSEKIAFVRTIRETLMAHAGRAVSNDELWNFLKCFVIIHFDFQNFEVSRDAEAVRDRLRTLFTDALERRAAELWDHLITQASRFIPVAGSLDRATLRQRIRADGFMLAETSAVRRRALFAIDQESQRALAEIKADIAGLRLYRHAASTALRKALVTARFIQIIGEPGTGKSALLKEFAEEIGRIGPVFVLKDARIQPRGWAAQANVLGVGPNCAMVLTDIAGAGEPILFIDGIDKIVDPAVQITVNDILRTIAATPHLSNWKVVVTVREQNLRHLETWIDGNVLKALSLASVTVTPLGREELATVSAYFPRLRALLAQGSIDVILHRAFFLNALLTLGTQGGDDAELPVTEIALLQLWWSFGGTDQTGFALAQEQCETLIALGERLAQAPCAPIALGGLSAMAIERLAAAGILRNVEFGHSVIFAHDIFEEWTLCETLIHHRADVLTFLRNVSEPENLIRPMQLLGTYLIETEPTSEAWEQLIAQTAASDLRPVWQRAVLLSCLQSTRTAALLNTLAPHLLADDAQRFRKLMLALRTIEVVPNRLFLNETLTPNINPSDRLKYANLRAEPRITVWVRFLDWLLPNITRLPHSAIPDLLPIFSIWQELGAGQNIRHCREIGQLAGDWLAVVERDLHPESLADRCEPFGLSLSQEDEEDLENSLRAVFLGSAAENPDQVTAYLVEAQTECRHRMYRDAIMKSALPLARHLPSALVDFMLATFLDHPDDHEDDVFYSRARSMIDDLGVAGDRHFYPPSAAQPPFLLLLRLHESEGLRLIHAFCNHSIAVWRWSRAHRAHYAPATPLSVTVSWDDHSREFWGDHQVYVWFRGTWGSEAVRSALMALELWALEQLDAGAPFAEIFNKAMDGNASVAVLGLAVSLCLAFPEASLAQAAPLVTCSHLWGWDIERWMGDRYPANEMSDWHRYRHLLSFNKELNERPHRQRDIRALLPYLIFGGGDLQQQVLAGVSAFPQHLPFEYEKEKGNTDRVAHLTEKMRGFAECGILENWRVQQTKDGEGYAIWCDPPSTHTESFKVQFDNYAQLNEYLALGLWANNTLDQGALDPKIALTEAWQRVQAIDDDRAFAQTDGDFHEEQRAAAIAGVAFVLARYSDDDAAFAWAVETLHRAVTAPEVLCGFLLRNSVLSMHPKVFAVHGYSGLLARDRHVATAQAVLLHAALNPLEGVASAVFTSMASYASKYPTFSWILMDLAIHRSIADYDHIPDHYSIVPDAHEKSSNERLLRRALRHVARDSVPHPVSIPMPWIKRLRFSWAGLKAWVNGFLRLAPSQTQRRRAMLVHNGYQRNSRIFLWSIAEKLIFKVPLAALMASPDNARRLIKLACELRDFTIMEVVPPFKGSRCGYRSDIPFDWVYACSAWLGKVIADVPEAEAKDRILNPVLAAKNETAILMLHTVMHHFMLKALAMPAEIAPADLELWQILTDWILANPEGSGPLDKHLDREYSDCVISLLFCSTAFSQPIICEIDPGWRHLPLFLSTVEKTVAKLGANSLIFSALTTFLKRGGFNWLPEPALGWLETIAEVRKADVLFWNIHGEDTVALLRSMVSNMGSAMSQELHQRINRFADYLVDSGVRGAGFLQQELLRLPSKH